VAGEALSKLELAAAAELARLGRRSGPALRFMRKALGYRAVELAALDVAPETLSRWETGEREVEGRAFALVGLLVLASTPADAAAPDPTHAP
jgi:DNA-binding transcriptional regulator YiaG